MSIWVIFEKFKEQLPSKERFYSCLTDREISGKEYEHVLKISNKSEMKKMEDYHNLYLKCDVLLHGIKKRIFVLRKFVKSAEKIIFSFVFVRFSFTEISYFLSFPSIENVRKQHLSGNAYFCVNMKFSYMIAGRKDEIFCVIL